MAAGELHLHENDVTDMPTRYALKRWRRAAMDREVSREWRRKDAGFRAHVKEPPFCLQAKEQGDNVHVQYLYL